MTFQCKYNCGTWLTTSDLVRSKKGRYIPLNEYNLKIHDCPSPENPYYQHHGEQPEESSTSYLTPTIARIAAATGAKRVNKNLVIKNDHDNNIIKDLHRRITNANRHLLYHDIALVVKMRPEKL
jgi:hypothetical protein